MLNDRRLMLETRDDAIDEIERILTKEFKRPKRKNRISAANAEILRSHLTYIDNNKQYTRYATLRKKGIPTGSGATKGACKSLIMIRTKGCGQRWHSRGVNAVLALRGLYMSNRLHLFWTVLSKQREVNIQVAA